MEAVVYSTFRNHLKDYMKKVNDEFEPLTVVNKNPDEDIVVISKSEWDRCYSSLQKMLGRIIVTGKVRTKKH